MSEQCDENPEEGEGEHTQSFLSGDYCVENLFLQRQRDDKCPTNVLGIFPALFFSTVAIITARSDRLPSPTHFSLFMTPKFHSALVLL